MLSFDISAVDIVLLVAVLILLSLYVSKNRETPKNQLSKMKKPQIFRRSQETKNKNRKPQLLDERTQTGFECKHHLGYLSDLPRNTRVPDECFGCPNVMHCLSPDE